MATDWNINDEEEESGKAHPTPSLHDFYSQPVLIGPGEWVGTYPILRSDEDMANGGPESSYTFDKRVQQAIDRLEDGRQGAKNPDANTEATSQSPTIDLYQETINDRLNVLSQAEGWLREHIPAAEWQDHPYSPGDVLALARYLDGE